jgi:hypothetical protein
MSVTRRTSRANAVGMNPASTSVFGLVSLVTLSWSLLPDRLTDQRLRDLLEAVPTGLLEHVPVAVRQGLSFLYGVASAVVGHVTYQGRWARRGEAITWTPRSPDTTRLFMLFYVRERSGLCNPHQDCRKSRGKT